MTGALQQFFRGVPVVTSCCSGIHGSHTHICQSEAAQAPLLTCWCCGGLFDRGWAAFWSSNGSRCFPCVEVNPHTVSCQSHVGEVLLPYRLNTQGIAV